MLVMSNINNQTSIINAFSGINKPEGGLSPITLVIYRPSCLTILSDSQCFLPRWALLGNFLA